MEIQLGIVMSPAIALMYQGTERSIKRILSILIVYERTDIIHLKKMHCTNLDDVLILCYNFFLFLTMQLKVCEKQARQCDRTNNVSLFNLLLPR